MRVLAAAQEQSGEADRESLWRRLAPVAVVVAVLLATYANSLRNAFHLDDHYRVLDNPGIARVHPVWRHFVDPRTSSTLPEIVQYRPLLPLTLSIDRALWGDEAAGYRAGTLVFLALGAVGVYALSRALLRTVVAGAQRWPAAWVAAAFAVHPITGILVNYVSARDQVLMFAGLAWALVLALRWIHGGGPGSAAGSCACVAFALLGKTDAAVVPVLVAWLGWTVGAAGRQRRRALALAGAMLALVAAFFAWTWLGLRFSDLAQVRDPAAGPLWRYPLTQARLLVLVYLPSVFWPLDLHVGASCARVESPFDPVALSCAGLVLASCVCAWRLRRRSPVVAFAIGAAWCAIAPSSSILPLYAARTDYRPFPALPFVLILLVLAARRWVAPASRTALATAFLAWLCTCSIWMNTLWRDGERLWSHSVARGGDALAHLNLAMAIHDRTDPRVRANLETAIRMRPDYVIAHVNLGLLLVDLGQAAAGLAELERAIAIHPTQAQAHAWYARALRQLGRSADAARESRRAAELDAGNLALQYQAMIDLQHAGDHAASLGFADAIIARDPTYRDTLFGAAFALQMTGRGPEAIARYREFLAQEPRHVQACFNLGLALMTAGDAAAAVVELTRTLDLDPGYALAHLHLATCFERLGDATKAAEHRRAWEAARR